MTESLLALGYRLRNKVKDNAVEVQVPKCNICFSLKKNYIAITFEV